MKTALIAYFVKNMIKGSNTFTAQTISLFSVECIKEDHTDERCFVVDLYEIEKMRKMHRMNSTMNKSQLEKRKDNADQSCVT